MKVKNVFVGMFFIIIAIVIGIKQLGFFQEVNILNIVLTIISVFIIIKSIKYLNFVGILFPLAIISIIYSKQLRN